MTATPTDIRRLTLAGGGQGLRTEGPASALYVMVMADNSSAKVGALERAANAEQRLRAVERKHLDRYDNPEGYPIRLAVVAELEGLDVTGPDADEAWARTTHYEGLLRFVLGRRFGRLAQWPDWIHIDRRPSHDDWAEQVQRAWGEIVSLGREGSTW